MKEAMFFEHLKDDIVKCLLCPHECVIADEKIGICGVRKNQQGELYSLSYDNISAMHIDPIEKKPLYHFYPGTNALSIATPGCNLSCTFCQNADLSQGPRESEGMKIPGKKISPKAIVEAALENTCKTIAYTYSEPTIFYELAYKTAKLAHRQGIKNIFVSNGFINPGPLKKIASYLDGANIDLKSFSDEFYRKICGARLEPVLESIKLYKKLNIWIELTTLLIPGENDSEEELNSIAKFIADVDPDIPWHISRFHPDYRMTDSSITPIEKLHKAYEIGEKNGLRYIYIGNVFGDEHDNSVCPNCEKLIIRRFGFRITENNIKQGKCNFCSHLIAGLF